jgi:hypothetical protein
MKAKEKIKQWLIEQGYDPIEAEVSAITGCASSYSQTEMVDFMDEGILGVVKNKQFIPIPQFEDDKPEPRDKALQAYIKTGLGVNNMFEEFNSRVKALESKVLDNE